MAVLPATAVRHAAQEEEFAQCIANGMTSREAMAQLGLSASPTNYLRLAKAPGMIERVRALVAQRLQAAGVTAERTKREIARVAYADVRRIFDKEGRLLPIHEIDDDTAAAITSITVQTKNVGSLKEPNYVDVVKIKFASKMDALGLLAKHFKLVNDEGDGVNALASALADRLNAAKRRTPMVEEVQDVPHRSVLAHDQEPVVEDPEQLFADILDGTDALGDPAALPAVEEAEEDELF